MDEESSPLRSPSGGGGRSAMTSPVHDFEPFEDEGDLLGDMSQADRIEEEEDGEELFGDNMEKYVLHLSPFHTSHHLLPPSNIPCFFL